MKKLVFHRATLAALKGLRADLENHFERVGYVEVKSYAPDFIQIIINHKLAGSFLVEVSECETRVDILQVGITQAWASLIQC